MSIARQLYQLQEIDAEIASSERALADKTRQLSENKELVRARAELDSQQKKLEELKQSQRSSEWEIDDISGKLQAVEEKLYGGRIGNPKELANLQHEAEILKTNRSRLEDKALEILNQVESVETRVDTLSAELKQIEAESQKRYQHLCGEIEALKTKLAELKGKRQALVSTLDRGTFEFYQKLRCQKGMAVARVEKGRCLGCRILLATTELQRARNSLVQCSSCGRILFVS